MKHSLLAIVLLCGIAYAAPGECAPLGGAKASFNNKVPGSGVVTLEEEFKGGERACVIVVGDHRPVCDVRIEVFDNATNALVAQDNGTGDYSAAIWYPARDGKYKIVIHNAAPEYNSCYVAIK